MSQVAVAADVERPWRQRLEFGILPLVREGEATEYLREEPLAHSDGGSQVCVASDHHNRIRIPGVADLKELRSYRHIGFLLFVPDILPMAQMALDRLLLEAPEVDVYACGLQALHVYGVSPLSPERAVRWRRREVVDDLQFGTGIDLSPNHMEIAQAETTKIEPLDAVAAVVALGLDH